MKCPLLQRYLIQGEDNALEALDNCLKGECAWWNESNESCAVKLIGDCFIPLGNTLGKVADRMPSDFAPRG